VVFDIGDEDNGLYLNADKPRPLGSTVKLQLLAAYAARLERGELKADEIVPLREWERLYLPRTDGGAHEFSLRALRAQGHLQGERARLADIVQAMMRYSDNAAADYFMWRLGREPLSSVPAELGMQDEAAPLPFAGQFLSWQSTQIDEPAHVLHKRYQSMGADAYASKVWELLTHLHDDPALSQRERKRLEEDGLTLRLREQAELARSFGTRGRASAYARLMARIERGELPGSVTTRDALGWPLQNPELAQQFESLGTKGGSLPGILTSAYYAKVKGRERTRVLTLFFERLPIAVWLQLMQSFVHQKLELRLLTDDAFLSQLKQRLAQ
jgi:D-alanyl-D-alanine carboxypeptidase